MGLRQDRLELRPPPGIAAGRQRAQRVAVVALPARDEMPALRLADLDEILPRHLHGRLDRLRAAGDEIDVIEPLRRQIDQPLGQFLGDIGGEEGGVGIGDAIHLRTHRRHDLGMTMTEAGDGSAARAVDIAAPVIVGDEDALPGDRLRQPASDGAMENPGHQRIPHRAGIDAAVARCLPQGRRRCNICFIDIIIDTIESYCVALKRTYGSMPACRLVL